eukprot:2997807-Amphidinium_carterae.1
MGENLKHLVCISAQLPIPARAGNTFSTPFAPYHKCACIPAESSCLVTPTGTQPTIAPRQRDIEKVVMCY